MYTALLIPLAFPGAAMVISMAMLWFCIDGKAFKRIIYLLVEVVIIVAIYRQVQSMDSITADSSNALANAVRFGPIAFGVAFVDSVIDILLVLKKKGVFARRDVVVSDPTKR